MNVYVLSGKSFSQKLLLQQYLPEAVEESGQQMANPVFFVSIDGEIVREVEVSATTHVFKNNLRIALQVTIMCDFFSFPVFMSHIHTPVYGIQHG